MLRFLKKYWPVIVAYLVFLIATYYRVPAVSEAIFVEDPLQQERR